ncbi:ADOR [Mytilus edulis]|uniref:ADORA2A n=1 Tax=Mytilus edulis TaxID=6550 RepID=A0A8S3RTD5_MYTED|nr:ADOR [Mytilus edulis]
MQPSCSKTNQCSYIIHSNAFGNKIQDEDKDTELSDIEIKIVTSNTEVNGEGSEIRKPCKMNSSQSCNVLSCPYCNNCTMMNIKKHSYSSTDDTKISANQDNKNMFQVRKTVQRKSESSSSKKNNFTHMENSQDIIDLKRYRNRNPFTISTDDGRSFDASRRLKKSWEIRAFLTTIIIAFQTITLTGPFVASFWIEAFSNAPLTLQFRLLLFIPYLINCISNPFIYAWRIPEIRHEFKKLFRINN